MVSSVESAYPAFSSAHYCLTQIMLVTCHGPAMPVVIQHVASLSSGGTTVIVMCSGDGVSQTVIIHSPQWREVCTSTETYSFCMMRAPNSGPHGKSELCAWRGEQKSVCEILVSTCHVWWQPS